MKQNKTITKDSEYVEEFLNWSKADKILSKLEKEVEYIERESLKFSIYGRSRILPRDQAFYGDTSKDGTSPVYRYGGKNQVTVKKWTPTLKKMRELIYKKTGHFSNHVVVNRYNTGEDYIGYHHDKSRDFVKGSPVITISLGETRNLVFIKDVKSRGKTGKTGKKRKRKRTIQTQKYALKHGSLFIMGAITNKKCKHKIEKTKEEIKMRVSLTFRQISTVMDKDGKILKKY